jgi:OOP family OmpA-OmpF porin
MAKKKDKNTIFLLLGAAAILFFAFRKKQKTVQEILKDVYNNLEFEFNSSVIKDSSFSSLDELANVLIKTNWKLKIAGHTDDKGSDNFNQNLSEKRANAVKTYLVNKGANPLYIAAIGYGETQPIVPNDSEENRAKNRRVEFTIYKQPQTQI